MLCTRKMRRPHWIPCLSSRKRRPKNEINFGGRACHRWKRESFDEADAMRCDQNNTSETIEKNEQIEFYSLSAGIFTRNLMFWQPSSIANSIAEPLNLQFRRKSVPTWIENQIAYLSSYFRESREYMPCAPHFYGKIVARCPGNNSFRFSFELKVPSHRWVHI